MPVARYRATDEVDAVRYDGWETNGPEVVTFLDTAFQGRVEEPDQLMHDTPYGTASLQPGSWLLRFVTDGHFDQMSPPDFATKYVTT